MYMILAYAAIILAINFFPKTTIFHCNFIYLYQYIISNPNSSIEYAYMLRMRKTTVPNIQVLLKETIYI